MQALQRAVGCANAVVAFDQQRRPAQHVHQSPGGRIQAHGPGQRQPQRLGIAQAAEAPAVRLQDMGTGLAPVRQAQPAIGLRHHRQLVLRTGQRQPHRRACQRPTAFAADITLQEQRGLQIGLGIVGIVAIHLPCARHPHADGTGALAADRGKQGEVVAVRDPQPLHDGLPHRAFRQQVAEPVARHGADPGVFA